jgi:hypothetical protein
MILSLSSNSYQTSGNSGLSALNPNSASSHSEEKVPSSHRAEMDPLSFRVSTGGFYRKMVKVKQGICELGTLDLDGMVRMQGIVFPDSLS